jgi:hypothetical protein
VTTSCAIPATGVNDVLNSDTHQRPTGEYVLPTKLTVNEALDKRLPGRCLEVQQASAQNNNDAMRSVRTFLGERYLQSLDEHDIDNLVQ